MLEDEQENVVTGIHELRERWDISGLLFVVGFEQLVQVPQLCIGALNAFVVFVESPAFVAAVYKNICFASTEIRFNTGGKLIYHQAVLKQDGCPLVNCLAMLLL